MFVQIRTNFTVGFSIQLTEFSWLFRFVQICKNLRLVQKGFGFHVPCHMPWTLWHCCLQGVSWCQCCYVSYVRVAFALPLICSWWMLARHCLRSKTKARFCQRNISVGSAAFASLTAIPATLLLHEKRLHLSSCQFFWSWRIVWGWHGRCCIPFSRSTDCLRWCCWIKDPRTPPWQSTCPNGRQRMPPSPQSLWCTREHVIWRAWWTTWPRT